MSSYLAKAKNVGGGVLILIGLAGIPDDIDRWQQWLANLRGMSWFTESALRWLLVILGLGLVLWANYPAIKNRWYLFKRDRATEPPPSQVTSSPLIIEFDGDPDVRWLQEAHTTFPTQQVQRKFYGVRVFNSGSSDVKCVALEVERIEQIPDRPGELMPFPSHLGLKFPFKLNGKPMMDFSPHLRDRVSLVSHVNAAGLGKILRMGSTQRLEFPHHKRRHRLYVKVTGLAVPHVSKTFIVWVDESGDMRMMSE